MVDNQKRLLYTQEYYRSFDLYKETKGKVLRRIITKLSSKSFNRQGAVALDIGCGRGELVSRLSKDFSRVYGLDYSEISLPFARENISKLPDGLREKICLLCADAVHLPFKNNTLDSIFSLDVFEHLNDVELKSLVKEMGRALKIGGTFIVYTMPNKEYVDIGYKHWIKPANKFFNPLSKKIFKRELLVADHYADPTHINLPTIKSLKHLFFNQGFKVRIYTRWFMTDSLIGCIYKVISQLWPITLFYPLRNLFCPFLWIEGEKLG